MNDSPPPSTPAPRVNRSTIRPLTMWVLPGQSQEVRNPVTVQRPVPLRDAYEQALRLHLARGRMQTLGHRVYCVTQSTLICRELTAEPDQYLVLGRHTSCDVVLEGGPTAPLRHLLVRSRALDDGCPSLSVLDLQTDAGFSIADGTTQRSIAAAGPIALRAGPYAIIALPSAGALPDELPAAAHEIVSQVSASSPKPQTAAPASPYRDPAFARPASASGHARGPVSRITLLPAASMLSERPPAGTASSLGDSPPAYAVTLAGERGVVTVKVSEEEALRGILVGRAPRCLAALGSVLHAGVSRVHLLLLREKGACAAYDLSSIQGTYVGGRRVRTVDLRDDGTTLAIGAAPALSLRWSAL